MTDKIDFTDVNIKTVKLGDLKPYKKNPRKNDNAVEPVANSIGSFRYKNLIVIDKDDNIVAGHTRYKAIKSMGYGPSTPIKVVVADDLTEDQVKAYRIADNSTGELAEWDMEILADILPDIPFDMADFGLDMDMVSTYGEEDPDLEDIVEDEAPEVDLGKEPTAKLGEIWILGKHRLMCGDSTSKADVEKLMDGNLAEMVFTDPPWNVNYGDPEHNYNPK